MLPIYSLVSQLAFGKSHTNFGVLSMHGLVMTVGGLGVQIF